MRTPKTWNRPVGDVTSIDPGIVREDAKGASAIYDRTSLAYACLSGVLLGLAYPGLVAPVLAWFGLVPLLLCLMDDLPVHVVYARATLTFVVAFTTACFWVLTHVIALTAAASFGAVLWHAALYPVPFVLAHRTWQRLGAAWAGAVLVALMVVLEHLLQTGPVALPMAPIGLTQAPLPPFNRVAAIGGGALLGGWVVALNLAACGLLVRSGRRRITPAIAAALLIGLPSTIPAFVRTTSRPPARVAFVQPGTDPRAWAIGAKNRGHALARLAAGAASAHPDITLWPEAAVDLRSSRQSSEHPSNEVLTWGNGTLLTGALTDSWRRPGMARNSAVLLRPGHRPAVYDKRRLVPFAEHVPFSQYMAGLRNLSIPAGGGVDRYDPGGAPALLHIGPWSVGVLICFETAFPDLSESYARDGSDFLVALSQSGWWTSPVGARQHVEHSRLRALETGRPLIHATVSGMSALALPDGSVRELGGWRKRTVSVTSIPVYDGMTPYVRLGSWTLLAALCCVVATIIRYSISWCTARGTGDTRQRAT